MILTMNLFLISFKNYDIIIKMNLNINFIK